MKSTGWTRAEFRARLVSIELFKKKNDNECMSTLQPEIPARGEGLKSEQSDKICSSRDESAPFVPLCMELSRRALQNYD